MILPIILVRCLLGRAAERRVALGRVCPARQDGPRRGEPLPSMPLAGVSTNRFRRLARRQSTVGSFRSRAAPARACSGWPGSIGARRDRGCSSRAAPPSIPSGCASASTWSSSIATGGRSAGGAGFRRGASSGCPRQETASVVVSEDDAMTLDLLCDHLSADRFRVYCGPRAPPPPCVSAATTNATGGASTSTSMVVRLGKRACATASRT